MEIVVTKINREIVTTIVFIMVVIINVSLTTTIVIVAIVTISKPIIKYLIYVISYELDVKEWRSKLLKSINCILINIRRP